MSTTSREEAAGAEILRLVEEQVELGPRVPGTEAHHRLAALLEERLRRYTPEVVVQEFRVPFKGKLLRCANVVGIFRAGGQKAATAAGAPPLLLGTHYDTRARADREQDAARRECPIPGANDGGSGTAVLLHMLPALARGDLRRDVAVAFFDAEDLGNIDGNEFSIGAEHLAGHPVAGFKPAEVVVLDMVGGAGMVFDFDAHMLGNPPSHRLTMSIFRIGSARGWEPFTRDKPDRLKYIVSDHYPFARRGIASCILIDIDYPQWHTQADTTEALAVSSLGITEGTLSHFLSLEW